MFIDAGSRDPDFEGLVSMVGLMVILCLLLSPLVVLFPPPSQPNWNEFTAELVRWRWFLH